MEWRSSATAYTVCGLAAHVKYSMFPLAPVLALLLVEPPVPPSTRRPRERVLEWPRPTPPLPTPTMLPTLACGCGLELRVAALGPPGSIRAAPSPALTKRRATSFWLAGAA